MVIERVGSWRHALLLTATVHDARSIADSGASHHAERQGERSRRAQVK